MRDDCASGREAGTAIARVVTRSKHVASQMRRQRWCHKRESWIGVGTVTALNAWNPPSPQGSPRPSGQCRARAILSAQCAPLRENRRRTLSLELGTGSGNFCIWAPSVRRWLTLVVPDTRRDAVRTCGATWARPGIPSSSGARRDEPRIVSMLVSPRHAEPSALSHPGNFRRTSTWKSPRGPAHALHTFAGPSEFHGLLQFDVDGCSPRLHYQDECRSWYLILS